MWRTPTDGTQMRVRVSPRFECAVAFPREARFLQRLVIVGADGRTSRADIPGDGRVRAFLAPQRLWRLAKIGRPAPDVDAAADLSVMVVIRASVNRRDRHR